MKVRHGTAGRLSQTLPLLLIGGIFVGGVSLGRVSSVGYMLGPLQSIRLLFLTVFSIGMVPVVLRLGPRLHRWFPTDLRLATRVITLFHLVALASITWSQLPLSGLRQAPGVIAGIVVAWGTAVLWVICGEVLSWTYIRVMLWVGCGLLPVALILFQTLGAEIDTPLIGAIGLGRLLAAAAIASMLLYTRSGRTRWLVLGLGLCIGVLASGHRSSVLALTLGMGYFVLRGMNPKHRIWLCLVPVVVTVTLYIAVASVSDAMNSAAWRLLQVQTTSGQLERVYLADRDNLSRLALRTFGDHPVLGAGLGSYEQLAAVNGIEAEYPHSVLLEALSTVGMLGTVPLIVFLITVARAAWQASSVLDHALVALTILWLTSALFTGTFGDFLPLWFTGLLVVANPFSSRRRRLTGASSYAKAL